jgi:hypothetical protein
MTLAWQNLIVLAIVAGATVYVARKVWSSIFARKASVCGSCRNCGTTQKPGEVFSIASQRTSDRAG